MKTRWLRIAAYYIKRSSYGRKDTKSGGKKSRNIVEGNDSGQFEASRVFDILQKLLQIRLHPRGMICSTLLIFHWQETWNVVSVCYSHTCEPYSTIILRYKPPSALQNSIFPYSNEKRCFNCFRISRRVKLMIDNNVKRARFVTERPTSRPKRFTLVKICSFLHQD